MNTSALKFYKFMTYPLFFLEFIFLSHSIYQTRNTRYTMQQDCIKLKTDKYEGEANRLSFVSACFYRYFILSILLFLGMPKIDLLEMTVLFSLALFIFSAYAYLKNQESNIIVLPSGIAFITFLSLYLFINFNGLALSDLSLFLFVFIIALILFGCYKIIEDVLIESCKYSFKDNKINAIIVGNKKSNYNFNKSMMYTTLLFFTIYFIKGVML